MSRYFVNNLLNLRWRSRGQWLLQCRWTGRQCLARLHWRPLVATVGAGALVASCCLVARDHVFCCTSLSRATCQPPPPPARQLHQPEQQSSGELHFDWHRLWLLVRPYLHVLTAAVCCAVVVALCNVQIPQLLGNLVSNLAETLSATVEAARPADSLKITAMRLVTVYICQSAATFSYIVCMAHVGECLAADLRAALFSSLLLQDVEFFDHHRTGQLLNRLTTDVHDFKSSFKLCVSQGLRTVTQVAGCAGALYHISPQLAVATLCSTVVMVVVGGVGGRLLRVLSRDAQQQTAAAAAVADEALANIRTVRAFAMELVESDNFAASVDESRRRHVTLGWGIGVFQAGYTAFMNAAVLAVLYWGGRLVQAGDISPGQLMAFLATSQTAQRSLSQLSVLFGTYVRGVSAGARVFEYLQLPPGFGLREGQTLSDEELSGHVEFRRVNFHYPTRPQVDVLNDLQLELAAGRVTAVVGVSGSGKSTCAALLERFYEPTGGAVLLDGRDIAQLSASWLRRRVVGLISQEPVLFAASVRDNIRYGNLDATDQQIEEAARLADAAGFIDRLPHGYDTMVGERGVALSGGQKQRLAIARALVKNPTIIVLDEATSALDVESERAVQSALDRVMEGRTVLVIAHRLSTVRHAHSIAVLNNGAVAEMGTHEELVKKKGLYWDLVKHNTLRDT